MEEANRKKKLRRRLLENRNYWVRPLLDGVLGKWQTNICFPRIFVQTSLKSHCSQCGGCHRGSKQEEKAKEKIVRNQQILGSPSAGWSAWKMSNEYGKKWKKTRLKRVRVSGESLEPKRVF